MNRDNPPKKRRLDNNSKAPAKRRPTMAAAPLQPPSNMRASQSAPPITILPIVDDVVSAASQPSCTVLQCPRITTLKSPYSDDLLNVPGVLQKASSLRTLASALLPADWALVETCTLATFGRTPVPDCGDRDRLRNLVQLLNMGLTETRDLPSQRLANAFDTLHWTRQLQLKLHNKERIRMAEEIAHIHELLNEQVAKTNWHKARIRKLDEDKKLSETIIQDDEDKTYALTEKVLGLEIRLKDTEKANLSCERDSLDNRAKAEVAHPALKDVEAELALYKTQSQSAPLQSTRMPTQAEPASESGAEPEAKQADVAKSAVISVSTTILLSDGTLVKPDVIELPAEALTTKNTMLTMVLQKHNRILKANELTKKHFDTVGVANPFAGPQGGWSDVKGEEFQMWMKMVQEVRV